MTKLKIATEHRPALAQVGEMVTVSCSCGFAQTVKAAFAAETWDGHVWMTVKIRRPHARALTAIVGDRPLLRAVPDDPGTPQPGLVFDDLAEDHWATGADNG